MRQFAATGGKRVVIVAPHPDDETIGAGGVAILHAQAGDRVQIVVVTDGRGSRAGGLSAEAMCKLRLKEMTAAAEILGVEFTWLGFPEWEWEIESAQLALAPFVTDADIVYTPSCIDFHPEHIRVAACIARVLTAGQTARIYQLGVPLGRRLVNVVADISRVNFIKNKALAAHQSQENAIKPLRRISGYLSKYYRLEAVECFWELPGDSFVKVMQNAIKVFEKKNVFRGIRPHSFTDPLAWLRGRAERKSLANQISSIHQRIFPHTGFSASAAHRVPGIPAHEIFNTHSRAQDFQPVLSIEYPAIRCPNCQEPLDRHSLCCDNSHQYYMDGEVLVLLNEAFSREFAKFLQKFNHIRREMWNGFLQPTDYSYLPFGKAVSGDRRWQLRQFDMDVIQSLLKKTNRRILEIGSYNGWLTHHLAAAGHRVMAIDYFLDDLDGLKTKKFYPESWQSIQMDIRDLSVLDEYFDIIIVNRCLQFFENPVDYFKKLLPKLSAGGSIYLLGLQIFKNPAAKRSEMAAEDARFCQKYGFNRWLTPVKGYLDFADRNELLALGVEFHPYSQLRLENAKSLIMYRRPQHFYGIYQEKHGQ